jgi:hypothetical protein
MDVERLKAVHRHTAAEQEGNKYDCRMIFPFHLAASAHRRLRGSVSASGLCYARSADYDGGAVVAGDDLNRVAGESHGAVHAGMRSNIAFRECGGDVVVRF